MSDSDSSQRDHLHQVGRRVERILAELRSVPDPSAREKAEDAVRLLVELYGAGLERMMRIISAGGAGELMERLADDELVASLLMVHGLHPVPVEERVQRALDSVRPYLGSHAGDVEFLGIDDDAVVHLALRGSCDGCGSSATTVKFAIEQAIQDAAPEVTSIRVAGMTARQRGEPTPVRIEPRPPEAPGEAMPVSRWAPVPGLEDLPDGELRVREVGGQRVVICRVADQLYAYRDGCPSCGQGLGGGQLRGEVLGCSCCQRRYHIRLAGRGVGHADASLEPLPLVRRDGSVRIAVAAAEAVL